MQNTLDFILQAGKLKKMARTGFVWLKIKNPETIAQHAFRVAIMNWILARKVRPELNLEKVIKISLVHDLCEVYVGDITPYDGILPRDKRKRYEFVRQWPRFSKKEKRKRYLTKLKKEKKSLERLTKDLPRDLKKEILDLWWDYEMGTSKEGRFVRQVDRVENLLEAFECWRKDKKFPTRPWWQHAEEVVDDPVLLEFLKTIAREDTKIKK